MRTREHVVLGALTGGPPTQAERTIDALERQRAPRGQRARVPQWAICPPCFYIGSSQTRDATPFSHPPRARVSFSLLPSFRPPSPSMEGRTIAKSPFIAGAVAVVALTALACVRVVPMQHVGVYVRAGKLLASVDPPGVHFYVPFLTAAHNIFTGIDHDTVPPSRDRLTHCRASDGGNFGIRLSVSNRLASRHVLATLAQFGIKYDAVPIYHQVSSSVKDVCSNMTSHDLAIAHFDRLDDAFAEQLRERQRVLNSSMEIVQVMIVDMQIPTELDEWFSAQAKERARQKALMEQRKADEEQIRNARQLHQAEMEKLETETYSAARRAMLTAEGTYNASRKAAEARKYEKELEAAADAAWLTPARLQFTEATADPLSLLIRRIKTAFSAQE